MSDSYFNNAMYWCGLEGFWEMEQDFGLPTIFTSIVINTICACQPRVFTPPYLLLAHIDDNTLLDVDVLRNEYVYPLEFKDKPSD